MVLSKVSGISLGKRIWRYSYSTLPTIDGNVKLLNSEGEDELCTTQLVSGGSEIWLSLASIEFVKTDIKIQ